MLRYSGSVKYPRVSFSLLLPLVELALWVSLVLVPTTLVYFHLHHVAQTGSAAIHAGEFSVTIPQDHLLAFALQVATISHSHAITAINLPGTFVEALISLPTSWPHLWHPPSMPIDIWRALTLPIFCLPAWWFVGVGLDALLGWRRLHWVALLTGSVLFVLFLVLFFGLRFGMSASERLEVVDWAFWGLGLWIALFGVLPCAWLRQTLGARSVG